VVGDDIEVIIPLLARLFLLNAKPSGWMLAGKELHSIPLGSVAKRLAFLWRELCQSASDKARPKCGVNRIQISRCKSGRLVRIRVFIGICHMWTRQQQRPSYLLNKIARHIARSGAPHNSANDRRDMDAQ